MSVSPDAGDRQRTMNLDELRSVRDEERSSGSLQPLRPSFYREAREFIADLRAERDRLAAESDEPFADPAVGRLTDRHESATEVLESIYENRLGKLLRHAATVAMGGDEDRPPLTSEEAELFDVLVDSIRSTKDVALRGEAATPTAGSSPEVEMDDDQSVAPPASPDGPDSTATPEPEPADLDRLTVRVTADVGTILGTDEREYELRPGDVVSLPVDNARALLEREAVSRIDADDPGQ